MNKTLDFIKSKSNIIIAIGVILCAIILIIPILNIALYNAPSTDDYSYGFETHMAWENTHNIFSVLKEAFKNIAETYRDWQGTFSAVFMFSMQPSIFGIQFYSITTFVLIFILFISNICLTKTIARRLFKYTKNSAVYIISTILTIFAIEMLPNPVQSLFWWNGSIYYTFYYSIMLLTISAVIKLITSENKKSLIVWTILSILLSVFLGGGNYPTALSYILILALVTLSLFISKNKNKYIILAITVITIISLLISMVAPGNAVRQATCDNSLGAIKSVFVAISEGANLIFKWTNLIVIIGLLILLPFILQVIKKSKFKFRYPLVFTIVSFGIFCSQLVPPLYAMNNIGEGRLIDMVYYSYYWLLVLNIGYYAGWLQSKFEEKTNSLMEYINERIIIYVSILFVILFIVCFPTKNYKEFTSYKALNSLANNEAVNYHNEIIERYKLFEDKELKDVSLKKLINHPDLLYVWDITEDKDDWVNVAVSQYFNKNSTVVEK